MTFEELAKSADDQINQYQFEFNDFYTRKKITDALVQLTAVAPNVAEFIVVCDETNNPPDVIMENKLVADIYLRDKDDKMYHIPVGIR